MAWIVLTIFTTTWAQESDQQDAAQPCTMYVLLDKKKQPTERLLWTLNSQDGFIIKDALNERRSDVLKEQTLELEVEDGHTLFL